MAGDVAQAASLCSWYITVRVCTQTGSPCYAPLSLKDYDQKMFSSKVLS